MRDGPSDLVGCRLLPKLVKWYTPAEALTMATSTNAELLARSGPRNTYPGKLGVVEEGALARAGEAPIG